MFSGHYNHKSAIGWANIQLQFLRDTWTRKLLCPLREQTQSIFFPPFIKCNWINLSVFVFFFSPRNVSQIFCCLSPPLFLARIRWETNECVNILKTATSTQYEAWCIKPYICIHSAAFEFTLWCPGRYMLAVTVHSSSFSFFFFFSLYPSVIADSPLEKFNFLYGSLGFFWRGDKLKVALFFLDICIFTGFKSINEKSFASPMHYIIDHMFQKCPLCLWTAMSFKVNWSMAAL